MIDEIVPQDWEEALWLSDLIRSKNNDDEKQPNEVAQGKGVEHDDIIF